jgi:hypothetical protein
VKDQVAIAFNGNICIAIPLYRRHEMDDSNLDSAGKYKITLQVTEEKPLAYVIDGGPEYGEPQLCNARITEKYLEFLGEL